MTKLYKKSEFIFAVLWIIAYIVLSGFGDLLSRAAVVSKSITAVLHIAMLLILFFWIRKNDLNVKYGFCRSGIPAKRFLFFTPLVFIASMQLWNGIILRSFSFETALYMISMCCVGFLEEVIFRGLLFRSLEKDSLKASIILSSSAFGLLHFLNYFNGSGLGLTVSIVQVFFAVLAGFVLVLIFSRGGSLIPCILFHAANNVLSVLGDDGAMNFEWQLMFKTLLFIAVLGGYLLYLLKAFPKNAEL